MSLADLVRRPRPADQPAARVAQQEPRVSLLPPELRAAAAVRATRRRLVAAVVAAAVVVAVGITAAAASAVTSQVGVLVSSARTSDLNRQLARYQAVGQLQQRIALVRAAERVGSSTAIDWAAYLKRIDAVTPASFTIATTATDSASAVADYPQGSSSVEVPRVGTIVLTASATSLADLPAWLTGLATLPGYADALPQTSTDPESGGYTVVVTMHVTDGAYAVPLSQGVTK